MRARLEVAPAPARRCDCSRCAWFVQNPDAVDPICSGSNTDCGYCGCARSEPGSAATCGQCPIRCGSRHDIDDWMAEVGTLAFDDLSWPAEPGFPNGLPGFVPQVDTKELAALNANLGWAAFAVGLRRVFSPVSWKILPGYQDRTANEALGLEASVATVLVGFGEDPLVEAFWTRRHDMFDSIAAQQWSLVLACNYSMYGNQPRTEHLINFRRNLQLAVEMRDHGIGAVPNLYWFRLEDLKRHVAWVVDEDVDAVAINLQTFRTDADWTQIALRGLLWLSAQLPASVRIVVCGASRPDRIAALVAMFGDRVHLVAANALLYARHGAVMGPAGREDIGAHTADAFAHNVAFYQSQIRPAEPTLSVSDVMAIAKSDTPNPSARPSGDGVSGDGAAGGGW